MKSLRSTGLTAFVAAVILLLNACAATKAAKRVPLTAEELFQKGMSSYHSAIYEDAEETFKRIMEDYPLSPQAVEAQLIIADLYYTTQRYEDAGAYYTTFYTFHPTHPKASYALFQKGMSHFKEVLTIDRDQTSTRKALFAFQDLVAGYPDSPYTAKAREMISFLRRRLAESEFYVARFYFKAKKYRGALMRFSTILKDYPDAGITDKVLYYVGESYTRLGEEKLAKDAFSTLIQEFPGSPFVEVAKVRLNDL